ncbi:NAD-dependent epimerase/dehydratase family protein, partial [Pseudomonadota bacterium]
KYPLLAENVNVEGTKLLLKAITDQKLIYTSSIAVYGDRINDPEIHLSNPHNPGETDYYAQQKNLCERLIKESGIDFSIMQLGAVLSNQAMKFTPYMLWLPLRTKVEFVHVNDVALALANAVDNDMIWGQTFHIGGGEECRIPYEDFINELTSRMGLGKGLFPTWMYSTAGGHCGYMMDSGIANNELEFQETTLEDFYKEFLECEQTQKRIEKAEKHSLGLVRFAAQSAMFFRWIGFVSWFMLAAQSYKPMNEYN